MDENYVEHAVYFWRQGEITRPSYTLPREEEFCIYVNGQSLARLMASPTEREALVLGFLYYSGLIAARADITTLHFPEGGTCADVWLAGDQTAPATPQLPTRPPLFTSGCGRGVVLEDLYAPPTPLPIRTQLTPAQLSGMAQQLQDLTARNPHSHGVHTSMLCTGAGEVVAAMTDVGRHNTLDKLIGFCLQTGYSPEDHVILTTGRLSSEMVSKAARMRVPLVATLRALTSTAVELAAAWGLTTVGYLRGQQMVVYTHPERLGIG